MVRTAPSIAEVMHGAAEFAGRYPLVAHNAAFDRKFWEHSVSPLGDQPNPVFVCALLLARRLFPNAPNYQLARQAAPATPPKEGNGYGGISLRRRVHRGKRCYKSDRLFGFTRHDSFTVDFFYEKEITVSTNAVLKILNRLHDSK